MHFSYTASALAVLAFAANATPVPDDGKAVVQTPPVPANATDDQAKAAFFEELRGCPFDNAKCARSVCWP